ncbi:hypothetical protein [Actinomadura miaoliensis]|uniref:DUF11 domain-containing protein n=1 Tax=Actinomadura miaoliensis TaxID=430685 RepID=A0ABP7X6H4_9ACTN
MIEKVGVRAVARGLVVPLTAVPLLATAQAAGPAGAAETRPWPPTGTATSAWPSGVYGAPSLAGSRGGRSKAARGIIITTAAPRGPLLPGRTYSWPFAVTNKNRRRVGPLVLRMRMSRPLIYVSGQRHCAFGRGVAACRLGTLRPEQTVVGVLTARVARTARPGQAVGGRLTVTWGRPSTVSHAFPLVKVARTADLSVLHRASARVRSGRPITYLVRVHNAGPSPARGVVVAARVPGGRRNVVRMMRGGCRRHEYFLMCHLGTIAPGGDRTLRYRLMPRRAGWGPRPGAVVRSGAKVTASTPDLNLRNNAAVAATRVLPARRGPW